MGTRSCRGRIEQDGARVFLGVPSLASDRRSFYRNPPSYWPGSHYKEGKVSYKQ